MPEVGEVTLEVLEHLAERHQIANAERPDFIVNTKVWEQLSTGVDWNVVQHPDLGMGLLGPNYRLFADRSVLPEEVEIAHK